MNQVEEKNDRLAIEKFDRLAKNAKKRQIKNYYGKQRDLLANIENDKQHILENVFLCCCERRRKLSDAMKKPKVDSIVKLSLYINITLAFIKLLASILTGSLAIMSSLVDSMLDLVSGSVTWYTSKIVKNSDPYQYPRGRTRMEPLGSIVVSIIMGVANLQLLIKAIESILNQQIHLKISSYSLTLMTSTIVLKVILFVKCKLANDPALNILKLDHLNDSISNSVAIGCAYLAHLYWRYLDPIGALLVSLYITVTWFKNGLQYAGMLSGQNAKPEFYSRVLHIALDHEPKQVHQIDTLKIYHFGTEFLVELHIVVNKNMPMHQAHDIAESLQRKIENLPYVERAFVHADFETTHKPGHEHKIV